MPAQFLERIALKDIQHFADDHAARTRGRRRHHVVAAVIALNRRQFARLVADKVFLRDQATTGLAGCSNGLPDPALVEAV
eukprot:8602-Eustigmatos_ZCMA.PRE.1